MTMIERGLIVERVDVRKPARQEDHDEVLSLCLVMGRPWAQAAPPPF